MQAGTTRYTQDLLAPLTQVLNDGSADYLYGLDRLAAQTGVSRTWYATDALSSVRQTLSNSGAVLSAAQYDPWGVVEAGSAAPFGFTGELTDGGLVNLRARWYNPAASTFISRDPFAGFAETPYSQHSYQYAYANPVLLRDPSGQCIGILAGFDTLACVAIATLAVGGALAVGVAANQALQQCGYAHCFDGIIPNAATVAANRANLARGVDYVARGGQGYTWTGDQAFSQTGPAAPPTSAKTIPPPPPVFPPMAPRPLDRSVASSGGFSFGQACELPGGFDWLHPADRAPVVTAPWGSGTQQGLVVLAAIAQVPHLVEPSELMGLDENEIRDKLRMIGAQESVAWDGGPRWRWQEDNVTYEVRYHPHANPKFPNGPSGYGPTIKFGKVIIGNGLAAISEQQRSYVDGLVSTLLGAGITYVDAYGVVYYSYQNSVIGRFTDETHIPAKGNNWPIPK